MIDLTEEVLEGLTVGQLVEALKDQDPALPITVFANGSIWTPKQVMLIEVGEDTYPTEEGLKTNVVELGCGWSPAYE